MKSKQLIVFDKIRNLYQPKIKIWWFRRDILCVELRASSDSPENYHILANAANKFYELVAINE